MQLSFIHRLFPVDVKHLLGDGCHLIHFVGVEGDDTDAHQVGQVVDVGILMTFALQFAYQRCFFFHTMLDGIDIDALFLQGFAQELIYQVVQTLQNGQPVTELLENHLSMGI